MDKYKVVIGLEVHCEVKTKTKNFSRSKNEYTDKPNINVSTVDLGLPGILPVVNKEAVRKAIKMAMALNCKIPEYMYFDRKNYYYPDLPKGYQLTQNTDPVGTDGYLEILIDDKIKKIKIHDIHLEEDTAALDHYEEYSLIDYNRSGIPLLEVVTEPVICSEEEAVKFLETLRQLFIYLDISDADSKKGQMRCDVNISLMKETDKELGTKVEMKNINSFSSVKDAILYEIERQSKILDKGKKVVQETRRIDPETKKTISMREKVDAVDYKYFIEPNIPKFRLKEEYLKSIKESICKLPLERFIDYKKLGLSDKDSETLIREKEISDYYDLLLKEGIDPKVGSIWVLSVVLATLNKLSIELKELFITPKMLGNIIKKVESKELSEAFAKKILYRSIKEKIDPIEIIEKEGLKQIDDDEIIIKMINEVLDESSTIVKEYFEGKDYTINYFVGGVMKRTKGQANPIKTKELIIEELKKRK